MGLNLKVGLYGVIHSYQKFQSGQCRTQQQNYLKRQTNRGSYTSDHFICNDQECKIMLII